MGSQAKDYGLVDELGGKNEVVSYIEKKEGITADIVEYKTSKSLLDVLSNVMSRQSFYVGQGIGSSLLDENKFSTVSVTT